jgi:beta-1,4-mannosyl-glycoprotein beta-1,4-N-acetylglucosaminyltransferase
MSQAKLFDSFPYNGEPVVELRLQHLAPHVDKFIIVEARQTHSGIRKDRLYIEEFADVFAPYTDKILFIIIDEFPAMPKDWPDTQKEAYMHPDAYESWYRERYQRDIVKSYLLAKFTQEPFLLICSDADEIVYAEVARDLTKQYFAFQEPIYLEMKFYYYHFGLQKSFHWHMAYVLNDLGVQRASSLSALRTSSKKTQFIANAGWHASYFFNVKNLQRKLESFAHRECDMPQHKTRAFLRKCLKDGIDISNRGASEDCLRVATNTLPLSFQQFQQKLLFLQQYS